MKWLKMAMNVITTMTTNVDIYLPCFTYYYKILYHLNTNNFLNKLVNHSYVYSITLSSLTMLQMTTLCTAPRDMYAVTGEAITQLLRRLDDVV